MGTFGTVFIGTAQTMGRNRFRPVVGPGPFMVSSTTCRLTFRCCSLLLLAAGEVRPDYQRRHRPAFARSSCRDICAGYTRGIAEDFCDQLMQAGRRMTDQEGVFLEGRPAGRDQYLLAFNRFPIPLHRIAYETMNNRYGWKAFTSPILHCLRTLKIEALSHPSSNQHRYTYTLTWSIRF